MLVTFSTKYYADITMFGDVGITMLKMMGLSDTVPSALLADDVPAALDKLKAAVAAVPSPEQGNDEDEPPVNLSSRALPLIELLSSAVKEGSDVMWK